ncbi:hypothetical protein QUF80_11780 [Desulfococcaceae bacterium HSG8]|nr:hypothetical protein [Desulfococcaceae bacterium HSG8]
MSYQIKWEEKGVIVRFSGIYSFKEDSDANIEMYSDSRFENLNYIIWDMSGISELNMTEEEAGLTSMQDRLASSRLPHVKMALLAQDKPTRKICEHYIAKCRNDKLGWEFLISDSMESIRSWATS